jgi:copper chaperone
MRNSEKLLDLPVATDGVNSAAVGLVPGGLSRLVISETAADAAVRDAVTSAGYSPRAK